MGAVFSGREAVGTIDNERGEQVNEEEFAEYEAERAKQDAYWAEREAQAIEKLREKRAADAALQEGDTGVTGNGYQWEFVNGQKIREDGAVWQGSAWAIGRATARAAKVEARRFGISVEEAREMLEEQYQEAQSA